MARYEMLRAEVETALAETRTRHFDERTAVLHEAAVRTRSRRDFHGF